MNLPETMRALVAYGPNDYRLEKVPLPRPGKGEVLIRVEACGICAGDLKASHPTARFWGGDGMPGYCEPPFIPGHEFSGHVVATGPDTPSFQTGDRVISEQIVPCGTCWYCQRKMYWLCQPHDVYGFKQHLNGGMAEYALLPAKALNYSLPPTLSLEQAALVEPFACALHGVRRAGIRSGDTVVLAGAGTLGLAMIPQIRLQKPKQLIVLDLNPLRLELAARFGADRVINPREQDAVAEVLSVTDTVGCDVYIEATGHPDAVQQGLDMIRKAGMFVEFSVMNGPSTIDWSLIGDAKEITIRGSQLSPYCYPTIIRQMAGGQLSTDGVVSHIYALDQWQDAFAAAASPQAVKVLIKP